MANRRLSVRKVKEILRLRLGLGLSERQVSRSCGVSRNTVREYVKRASEANLNWPIPKECDLEAALFKASDARQERPIPNWEDVHREMKRKGVTLKLLWEEYKETHPRGYQYTQFCTRYKRWLKTQNLSMPQIHKAGEKMFVDYAGQTVSVESERGGFEAQIFIAVLGASDYAYVEASESQKKLNWLMAHVNAFEFFEGVPEMVVPDNLKSGVSRACRYEPDLNPSYQEMACHYETAICPARVKKPKDKANVENAVLTVERWILARIRNRRFGSLAELNQVLHELLKAYNAKPFQKRAGSRQSEYEQVDRPALKPLPASRYEYAEWKQAKCHVDYHVEVERKYYSVPYRYHGRVIDVRITRHTIEGYYRSQRIMSHRRLYGRQRFSTHKDHMPANHRWVAEWSPERFIRWGGRIGVHTKDLISAILSRRTPLEQGYRTCLGILSLAKKYETQRLENACKRALAFGGTNYKSVKSILEKGLDRQQWEPEEESDVMQAEHGNVRGAGYFQKGGH